MKVTMDYKELILIFIARLGSLIRSYITAKMFSPKTIIETLSSM